MHSLFTATTPFIGRQSELTRLAEWLDQADLVTLTGLGGVGKTRLAEAAAAERLARGEQVVRVALGDVTDEEGLCAHMRAALLGDVAPVARTLHDVGRLLAAQGRSDRPRPLIVVDEAERIRDVIQCALRVWLAPAGPRFLVTSRARLGLPGETVVAVEPLSLDTTGGTSDAARLFLDRARRLRGNEVPLEEAGAVERLVRRLEGHPLAIELVAARSRLLDVEGLLARLDRLPSISPRPGHGRHASLDRVFMQSWLALTALERRTLTRCADEALDPLIGAPAIGFVAARMISLARVVELLTACLDASRQDDLRAIALLERATVHRFLGDLDEAEVGIDSVVQIARRSGSARLLGRGLNERAAVLFARGRHPEASSALAEATPLLERSNDRSGVARAINTRGAIAVMAGHLETAHRDFGRAVEIASSVHDEVRLPGYVINLGLVQLAAGAIHDAEATFQRALEMCEASGLYSVAAVAKGNLAGALRRQRRLDEAARLLEMAFREANACGMRGEAAQILVATLAHAGRLEEAEARATVVEESIDDDCPAGARAGVELELAHLHVVRARRALERGDEENGRLNADLVAAVLREHGGGPPQREHASTRRPRGARAGSRSAGRRAPRARGVGGRCPRREHDHARRVCCVELLGAAGWRATCAAADTCTSGTRGRACDTNLDCPALSDRCCSAQGFPVDRCFPGGCV